MEGDFQVCRNCKRNVASVHFSLHEAHCLRFLVVCPDCEEPIPKSKMKEHTEAVHQQTKEIQQLSATCKFCELAVHLSKLDVHESYCGSRTEHCPHCNRLIMLQELAQHTDVCLGAKTRSEEDEHQEKQEEERTVSSAGKRTVSPRRKTRCDYCKQMIPENKYVSHMKQCPASSTVKYLQDGKPKILPPSLTSQVRGNQTSTSTVKRDVRPKTKSRNSSTKQETKEQNGTLDLPLKSASQQRAALPGDEAAYDILRRCYQCGILLPLPVLSQHQEKCLRLAHLRKTV